MTTPEDIPSAGLATRPLDVRTEPVQQRSTVRITALLDAAAALIDEIGIDGLTTSEVAVRSGSSVGVVYRYFPNIQSLLRGLATRNMERFTERVTASVEAIDPALGWTPVLDATIDAYVELTRTEPGFRALRFGDIIDDRFLLPHEESYNSMISRAFTGILTSRYGMPDTDDFAFDLEVVVEIADSLLHRAFLYERDGDPRFIEKLRTLAVDYLSRHEPAVTR